MNYQVFEGEGRPDGISYYLHHPAALSEIPADFLQLLTPQQTSFFREYPASLHILIAETRQELPNHGAAGKWLQSLAGSQVEMEIHLIKSFKKIELDEIWLRFALTGQWKPAISLKEPANSKIIVPGRLQKIYKTIGAVNHHGYLASGGLEYPFGMATGAGFIKGYTRFYSTQTGDSCCYNREGQVYFYNHESDDYQTTDDSNLCFFGTMDEFMAEYFTVLLSHQELTL